MPPARRVPSTKVAAPHGSRPSSQDCRDPRTNRPSAHIPHRSPRDRVVHNQSLARQGRCHPHRDHRPSEHRPSHAPQERQPELDAAGKSAQALPPTTHTQITQVVMSPRRPAEHTVLRGPFFQQGAIGGGHPQIHIGFADVEYSDFADLRHCKCPVISGGTGRPCCAETAGPCPSPPRMSPRQGARSQGHMQLAAAC